MAKRKEDNSIVISNRIASRGTELAFGVLGLYIAKKFKAPLYIGIGFGAFTGFLLTEAILPDSKNTEISINDGLTIKPVDNAN